MSSPQRAPVEIGRPAIAPTYNVRTISSIQDFGKLNEAWNSLLARSDANSIFLTWEWLYSWWQQFGGTNRLMIKLVERDHELIGIAPLFIEHTRVQGILPMRIVQWLGVGAVGSDYLDLIAAAGCELEVAEAVAQQLALEQSEWDLLRLSEILDTSLSHKYLREFFAANGNFEALAGREYSCPFIDLSDHSWSSYQESLSSNMRYNLRRRIKQVFTQLRGEVSVCERAEDVGTYLDEIMELHAKRWRARGGSDGFEGGAVRAFHLRAAERLFARGWLKLYLLKIENHAVAGIYAIEYGGIFSFYQSGFDPDWDRYSVGMVLMGRTVQDAITHKMKIYDFLHGTEDYKFKWTANLRKTASLLAYPKRRLMPRCYFWLRSLKSEFNRLGNKETPNDE